MGLNSGLFGLLLSIWIACCSTSLPPPFFFNSRLHGNDGEAPLHIIISTKEVFQRDPTVTDRLGPFGPFALAQVFEVFARIVDLFFFAARLRSQESDRADMRGLM